MFVIVNMLDYEYLICQVLRSYKNVLKSCHFLVCASWILGFYRTIAINKKEQNMTMFILNFICAISYMGIIDQCLSGQTFNCAVI